MTGAPDRIVATDPVAAAAQPLAGAVERIAAERGRARVAIPGGSAVATASLAFALLDERGFDFARLWLTWVDERCVPASSPESNRGAVSLPAAAGVELPLFEDGETPADAVARVERELRTSFAGSLDVVLLGMGTDGHVASLFPGRPPLEGLVAHVGDSPKPPRDRITLTPAILHTARHTFLVAAGETKRAALARLADGDTSLPAVDLPGLVVFTDQEPEERP